MDQNVVLECANLQAEEYEVIKAIYPDFILSFPSPLPNEPQSIRLQIGIQFSVPTKMAIYPMMYAEACESSTSVTEIAVKHLPPILLDISLPQQYPVSDPPTIGAIKFHSSWLMGADGLKATLLDMWDAGETTIYSWIEYLQTGQFLEEDEELRKKIFYDPPAQLSEILLDYDLQTQRTAFLEGTYLCDVCFEYKKGTQCIFLSCSHTFCKACLREFWTAAVQEGDIGKLVCINPRCMKTKTVASEEEIRDVLSDNAFRRWKWLKEKREFEQDVNHAYCPICESPARPSTGHVPENKDGPWSRYRECPKCRFTFCRVCRCVWHGPHFDCPVPVQILTRYMDAIKNGTDASWMKLVEQTYTSGVLQRQIKRFREEAKKLRKTHSSKPTSAQVKISERWLATNTQCCPGQGCGAYIQRTEGCNHMVCSLCKQSFCYGCGRPFSEHGSKGCSGKFN